jgi:putative endonuclease
MIFYVYVLQSVSRGIFYTGHTHDLEKRIRGHNSSMNIYTKSRGPWKLIHFETYFSRSEAMRREKFLKTGKGRDEIKHLIKKMNNSA